MRKSNYLALVLSSNVVFAEDPPLPKVEFGVALGAQYLADYRGSSEYNSKALPIPFFIYRGERVNVDRRGLRGELLSKIGWEINASGEVSLSGGNGDNVLREGMPELDSTFELGPSLNIALSENGLEQGWLLRLPLRAVISIGTNGVGHQGWLFNPKITYVYEGRNRDWRFSSSIGVNLGSNAYHDYYYRVAPRYEAIDRPVYDAESGYSGAFIKTSLIRRHHLWRYGVSFRYDNLNNAAFLNSPLVEESDYWAVSVLVARFLWKSPY